jgi:hypothetical protein
MNGWEWITAALISRRRTGDGSRHVARHYALYRILDRLQVGRVLAGLPGGNVAEPKFAEVL